MCGKLHRNIFANSSLAVFSSGSSADVQNLKRIDTFQIREGRMGEGEFVGFFFSQLWIVSSSASSHIFKKMFT